MILHKLKRFVYLFIQLVKCFLEVQFEKHLLIINLVYWFVWCEFYIFNHICFFKLVLYFNLFWKVSFFKDCTWIIYASYIFRTLYFWQKIYIKNRFMQFLNQDYEIMKPNVSSWFSSFNITVWLFAVNSLYFLSTIFVSSMAVCRW